MQDFTYRARGNGLSSTAIAEQRLLTVTEVAQRLSVSPAWVREHASGRRRPVLPVVRLGKLIRFRRESVEEFIQACERFAKERGLVA